MKSVAIVGAGPAGLVAAKTLLRHQNGEAFRVTVFEKYHRLGGLWALDEDSTHEGFLSAHTPTNLSKFTVSFSDLSWDSVDILPKKHVQVNGAAGEHDNESTSQIVHVPMFPKAWQAGKYLETYAAKFIPRDVIKYNHAVVDTERINENGHVQWNVTTDYTGKNTDGQPSRITRKFDHLIVASGFFSQPRALPKELSVPQDSSAVSSVKALHSSQYRGLGDIFHDGVDYKGKKILLAGGGNSAGEVAGTVAFHLSSALHSSPQEHRFDGCKVYHISPRPLYGVPPFVPAGNDQGRFVPIDLRLYDLAARPPGDISSRSGKMAKDFIPIIHGVLQGMVGGDQSDLGSEATTVKKTDQETAPYVALSESYSEFVRAGAIQPKLGRLVSLENRRRTGVPTVPSTITAIVQHHNEIIEIDDVAAVIHATGYAPSTALDYLPVDIKQVLEYDPKAFRLPLLLDQQQTMSKSVPDLAFVGFYEGPYWGIMEMQARFVAQRWSGVLDTLVRPFEELEKLRDLRKAMECREPQVPQYWLGDYLGYMEELARDLHLRRNDQAYESREGVVTPARYLSEESDDVEAARTMVDLHQTVKKSADGAFIARICFRAMQGCWHFRRRLDSAIASFPSGVVEGNAFFHPRIPTIDGVTDDPYDFEYLYIENGSLTTNAGATMSATRRYVYRFRESDDRISVWFVKNDGLSVDYPFHQLQILNGPPSKPEQYVAVADHLCVNDMYKTEYEFSLRGITLSSWKLSHGVKGPSKDYTSTTEFKR